MKEYRRHHSPERPGMVPPDRKKYGSPDRKHGSRPPITNSQWGEAATQIRHVPKPTTFVVAAGPERKSKEIIEASNGFAAYISAQSRVISGGGNVVGYNLSKTSDREQVLESMKEYRRRHSPERPGMVPPDRKKYGSPDRKQ